MSEPYNFKFEKEEGMYFQAYIKGEERWFFIDIAILEDMTRKKIQDNVKAQVSLYSIRTYILRMCDSAVMENPNWPSERPLPLARITFK
jgi:hypothetical protein